MDDTLVLHHDLYTNGIGYLTLLFDEKGTGGADPYMGILKSVLGYVDTENYSYADLFNEINANSGGILFGLQVFGDKNNQNTRQTIKAKHTGLPFVFSMIKEIICTSKMDQASL